MENLVENKPRYGSFEHWYNYLHEYMEDHGFSMDDSTIEDIKSSAKMATEVYDLEVKTGNPCGAGELAIKQLFSSVGDSKHEVIVDLLETEFRDCEAFDFSNTLCMNFWVDTLSDIPGIFDGCEREWGYGLDSQKVEDNYQRILETIRTFLTENGFIQQTPDTE